MENFKAKIEAQIVKKGYTKDLVYSNLGMTRQGFEYALKNETLRVSDFAKIVNILAIDPNEFFGIGKGLGSFQAKEPMKEYVSPRKKKGIDTKSDSSISEVDFLRSQVEKLTKIVENLSRAIDTKNINS